jgi:hypothetical protein
MKNTSILSSRVAFGGSLSSAMPRHGRHSKSKTALCIPRLGRFALALALFSSLFLPMQSLRAQEVELFFTDQTDLSWNDVGSGAHGNVGFWSPRIPAGQGYVIFGQTGRPNYETQGGMTVAKAAPASTAFANPTGYYRIWTSSSTGSDQNGYFWRPVPPAGYVSMGDVVTGTDNAPSLTAVVCVRSDLVVPASIGAQLWNSAYTQNNYNGGVDFSAYQIDAPPGAINLGGFVANASYEKPNLPVYCLKGSAVVSMPVPSNAELEQLIQQFGPKVKFHPLEPYLPDDPAAILDDPNTHLDSMMIFPVADIDWSTQEGWDNGRFEYDSWQGPAGLDSLYTSSAALQTNLQSVLSHPLANDPHFRYVLSYQNYLLPGNMSRARALVRVQPYMGAATEIQFWMFCAWNGTGKSRVNVGGVVNFYDPTGTMGRHYSDWENVRIRVTSKNVWNPGMASLVSVVMSRHSGDLEVTGTDPGLEK